MIGCSLGLTHDPHHSRDTGPVNIRIHQPNLGATSRQCHRQVGSYRRFADPSLAACYRNDVLHIGQETGSSGGGSTHLCRHVDIHLVDSRDCENGLLCLFFQLFLGRTGGSGQFNGQAYGSSAEFDFFDKAQ